MPNLRSLPLAGKTGVTKSVFLSIEWDHSIDKNTLKMNKLEQEKPSL